MKKILIGLVAIVLIAPMAAKAQTVDTAQMTNTQLRTYLIGLIQEVIQLEQQLETMQTATSTPIAPTAQVAAPAAQAPVVLPPAQPQAVAVQAPVIAADSAPQPSGYTIQIVAWPGPVTQVTRTFIASSTLQKATDDTTDNSHINLGAILLNPSGKAVNDATMTVITDDDSQNETIDGTGNAYGRPAVAYYPFSYVFKTVGSHTITFSAMGATNSITLQAN